MLLKEVALGLVTISHFKEYRDSNSGFQINKTIKGYHLTEGKSVALTSDAS